MNNKNQSLQDVQIKSVFALYSNGQVKEALNALEVLTKDYPNESSLYNIRGVCYKAINQIDASVESFKKALTIKPDDIMANFNLGIIHMEIGQLDSAVTFYEKVLKLNPNYSDAHYNLAITFEKLGSLDSAVKSYKNVLTIKPDHFASHNNLGILYKDLGNQEAAVKSYKKAIAIKPDFADAHNNLGVLYKDLGNQEAAVKSYKKAIAIKPDFADAHNNLGFLFYESDQLDLAAKSFKQAIAIKPDFADAHNNLGVLLDKTDQLDLAAKSFKQAIAIKPDFADAHNNLGVLFDKTDQLDLAAKSFKQAIAIKPDFADAHNNLGVLLDKTDQLDLAAKSFKQAIAIKPDFAEAHNNLGVLYKDLGNQEAAVKSFKQAIAIKPDFAEAYHHYGIVLTKLNRRDEALVSFESAISHNPDLDFLMANHLSNKMYLGMWNDLPTHLNGIENQINNGEIFKSPFALLFLIDNPELQRKNAEAFASEVHPQSYNLPSIGIYPRHKKIRIAYFSGDFHNHPGMHLMAELFECHDKNFFELIAFSFGPDTQDEWRRRVSVCFDQFVDVRLKSDQEIALLARKMEIDIAINRGGYTQGGRPNIFAEGCAPLQVNYLGYPGTTGAEYMDYIIADRTLIPEDKQQYYSEKIVYMPNSYQVNMSNREVAKNLLIRDELGLPVKGFVFCCFNNAYKITPSTFAGWMRILSAVEDSVLWLLEGNATHSKNIKNQAMQLGVNEDRIVFAKRMPVKDHLNRIKEADLFIDTLPYNAHTTASEALRMGLPVLTCEGRSFASRVAASLLRAVNLPELITTTQEQFESVAIKMAMHPEKFNKIKNKLINNLPTASLYDAPLYTRHLESAFLEMYERNQSGLNPDHIYVEH